MKSDLFVVVADLDAENAIGTLLTKRQESLGINLKFSSARYPTGDLLRYSGRDSGCYTDAVNVLRPSLLSYRHALLIFDKHGCGAEDRSREVIEAEIEDRLCRNGWSKGSAAVIVIEPELESWVWAESPRVTKTLGWGSDTTSLRNYLNGKSLWDDGSDKPKDPKEAMKVALKKTSTPHGASVFADLASRVGVSRCQDLAFEKFRDRLSNWFGVNRARQ